MLKQCRAAAMTAPNIGIIAHCMAACEGLVEYKAVGTLIVQVFNALKEKLPAKFHYDYGLRPLKKLIRMVGERIQANPN